MTWNGALGFQSEPTAELEVPLLQAHEPYLGPQGISTFLDKLGHAGAGVQLTLICSGQEALRAWLDVGAKLSSGSHATTISVSKVTSITPPNF